tara:strand:+ start:1106 stop:1285 length:180 start_codon:yes stop_codon:yes gene_type:complete
MNSSSTLYELQELKKLWRNQSFYFSQEQKKRYQELTKLRHARVKELYENDMVFKPGVTK